MDFIIFGTEIPLNQCINLSFLSFVTETPSISEFDINSSNGVVLLEYKVTIEIFTFFFKDNNLFKNC